MRLKTILSALSAAALGGLGANIAAAEAPRPGCYERIYDAAHLAMHVGQIIVRATVVVKRLDAAEAAALGPAYADMATLRLWVKGRKQSFDSIGACKAAGGGLSCEGSLSAAEADACRTNNEGAPFLYLSPGNAENHAFALKPAPDSACQ